MTRIVLLSDTHTLHAGLAVPEGDIVVHAGDFCGHGTLEEAASFLSWFSHLPHKRKVVIAGNHDWCLQTRASEARKFVPDNVTYLQDRACVIDGLTFYGSPWQPEFYGWAFNLPRGGMELRARWAAIPDETQVLITHGPPAGVLDHAADGRWGCELLAERVAQLPALKLHVFGHIHESAGREERGGVTYVNAAVCTRAYEPTNPIHVVDL